MSVVVYKKLDIAAPLKIPSVNNMYKPKSSFGKSFAWLYKDNKVQLYQDEVIRQSSVSSLSVISQYADKIDYVDVEFCFLLDKNLDKRDVSNMIKMTEDALMMVTKIDDSRHRKVTALKAMSLIPKMEFVICKYEVHLIEDK